MSMPLKHKLSVSLSGLVAAKENQPFLLLVVRSRVHGGGLNGRHREGMEGSGQNNSVTKMLYTTSSFIEQMGISSL